MKNHWDNVYQESAVEKLGWHESDPRPSMELIEKCRLDKNGAILNVGAGATTLVDKLLEQGYGNIIVNDISSTAIFELQNRLGQEKSSSVRWIEDDLTHPTKLRGIGKVDLWHDRAVLHFFTDEKEQANYFDLLRELVSENGFVIIAAFNLNGATKCSGLPVYRYDSGMLQNKLGEDFVLQEAFNHTYVMPSGNTREYVYTLFQRKQM
jgi:hypothetical protein